MTASRLSVAATTAVILAVTSWVALVSAMQLSLTDTAATYMPGLVSVCIVSLVGSAWLSGYSFSAAPVPALAATGLCILLIAAGLWSQRAYG